MTNSGDKGERGEREIAGLLTDLLGRPIRRKLGAGRLDDVGDLDGLPGWTLQVVWWTDALRAVREKPIAAEAQRLRAHDPYAATFVRLRGGLWRSVQTLEQFAEVVR